MRIRDWIRLGVIACALAGAGLLFGRIDAVQGREETEIVRKAVKDAALNCYAVERAYPENVDYLRTHYRLAYDEERYFVTYDAFSSNVMPDIWVTEKGAKAR